MVVMLQDMHRTLFLERQLPFENRKAMAFLQDKDKNLIRVKSLLSAGQVPSQKRDETIVKCLFRSDLKTSIDKDGCLVVSKINRHTFNRRDLIVVPDNMSYGLLYSLHQNLLHPTAEQLHRIADTRFFIKDLASKCKTLSSHNPCRN